MVFAIIFLFVGLLVLLYLGGKELVGEWLFSLFPVDTIKNGDRIDVFLDGKHNRTATITGITLGSVKIYRALHLPLDYRGTFYATGVDRSDGSKLVYIKNRKYYKFVRAAELVRKAFDVLDDDGNLIPDDPVMVEASTIESEIEEDSDGL